MFLDKPKFYGRRIGRRIRKAKTSLLEAFLPKVKLQKIDGDYFDAFDEVRLEIGFGDGQHLAGQAKNNPNVAFIGAEVFQNGVANLLSLITGIKEGSNLPEDIEITKDRADNIRIFDDDMRILFPLIPDNFLNAVYVLFPDPWPKKRHAHRRFINPENLDQISRILKKDGLLRIATDHKIYKSWALRRMKERKDFVWTAKSIEDWRNEPKDWVKTKYQQKALREGRQPVFLDFKKT